VLKSSPAASSEDDRLECVSVLDDVTHPSVLTSAAVLRWSGREARALREARRMSVREFAAHLGVSDRVVSKWEAGGPSIRPRPFNQAALDTSLARSSAEVKARFAAIAQTQEARAMPAGGPHSCPSGARHLVRHPLDGKAMTLVDAGVYEAGRDGETRWLPGFYVDVYPTTNADYARFLESTGRRPPIHWLDGRCPPNKQDHPVVNVSHLDAEAYARWAAKALPSREQWEKAARGASGQIFPWGNTAAPGRCNSREARFGATTPVSWYDEGVSPYGVFDMCGNVWEWCASHSDAGRRVLKGGAFTVSLTRAAPWAFHDASVEMYGVDIGFRCVAPVTDLLALLSI
jgi:formylglycine-generating enzyme required for sulfatase activity